MRFGRLVGEIEFLYKSGLYFFLNFFFFIFIFIFFHIYLFLLFCRPSLFFSLFL